MTERRQNTRILTVAGLLTALGILIPLIMPIKIVIGPASYTLGSHTPVNMALFISPAVAAVVSVGSTLGFLAAGFPFVIVIRALSHIIYATIGAALLQKFPHLLQKTSVRTLFSLGLNLLHGLGELVVVWAVTAVEPAENYLFTLLILVGLGTVIHGMIDFELSYHFARTLKNRANIAFTDISL